MDSYNLDKTTPWANRIAGHDSVDPESLLANPLNFHIHTKLQQDALAGSLDTIGWVRSVLVNLQTGHIIDGHARVTLALRKGEAAVPVEYVNLNEKEERIALSTLDPLVRMAIVDNAILSELTADLHVADEALQSVIHATSRELQKLAGLPVTPTAEAAPPNEFPTFDSGLQTDYRCPKCGYEWSGKPK